MTLKYESSIENDWCNVVLFQSTYYIYFEKKYQN